MSEVFSSAEITPCEVLAGDSVEFVMRLTVGSAGTAERCRIIVDCPEYLGQDRPTRMDQESGGYIALFLSNPDVKYSERVWDMEVVDFVSREKSSFKGMAARMMVFDLEGAMQEGDVLEVRWGWMRNGHACGCKVATVVPAPDFENLVHVRYFSDPEAALPDLGHDFEGYSRPQPDAEIPLSFVIRPREVVRLRLIRGIDRARLVPYDRFYNVAVVEDASTLVNVPPGVNVNRNAMGVFEFDDPDVQLTPCGLPMECTPSRVAVHEGYNLYFGDLHTHSSFSNDCIEREKSLRTPDDLYGYARDVAGADFLNVTDHHQPWDVARNRIGRELWELTCEAARTHHAPGRFITFTGIEYRAKRGDTAVVFGDELDYDVIANPEMSRIDRFWELMKGHDFLTIPHFHNGGGLEDGVWIYPDDPHVEPVMEMYSCHGSYEAHGDEVNERHTPEIKWRRPDRNAKFLLRAGYRYGLVCNSDGHKGVVANNGLTAVFARDLTRQSIMEAIRARRCYGTTNARIRLVFTLNGALMGSEIPDANEKAIHIDVAGEAPFKAVDLMRNGELHRRFRPNDIHFRVDLKETSDDPSFWYVRATQIDNHIAWSSPIWVG